jgi:hypothetical protein
MIQHTSAMIWYTVCSPARLPRTDPMREAPEITNIARATCSLFFLKKYIILKFQKYLKLNMDMDNVEIYKRVIFQLEIPYNVGGAKKKEKYVVVNNVNFYVRFCHFYGALNIRYLDLKLCKLIEHNICLHLEFFTEFFETLK